MSEGTSKSDAISLLRKPAFVVGAALCGVIAVVLLVSWAFESRHRQADSDGPVRTIALPLAPMSEAPPVPPLSPSSSPSSEAGPSATLVSANITNSLGMKLVLVPAGEFLMGSPEAELAHGHKHSEDESPQHWVGITQPFYLGQYEVTQGEYEQIMGSNSSAFSRTGDGKHKITAQNMARFPAEQVSWDDAQTFCQKLSAKEGRTYRLPTEAEWEYACRAGTTMPFNFGAELNGDQANCNGNYPYGTTTKGTYLERTTVVGSYSPNAYGLYDMHGNVWEWCSDWYATLFYKESPVADPHGPSSGSRRVARGGGWDGSAAGCRSANRCGFAPSRRGSYLGFRVALVLSDRHSATPD